MHKYCLDTSGFSNPALDLPENIFVSLWPQILSRVDAGMFCWNSEIAKELLSLPGGVGDCLKRNGEIHCYEIADDSWDWPAYVELIGNWHTQFENYISEYNGNRKNTIGLNDLSIVALAKTLRLPVVSMEKRNTGPQSANKMRIPDLCSRVSVQHLDFIELLLAEGIRV